MMTPQPPDGAGLFTDREPQLFARVQQILASGALGRLSEADTKVLFVLFARADWRRCVCWPAVPRIQAEAQLARSAVYDALRRLSELGLLRIGSQSIRCRDGKRRQGNVYEILTPPPRPPATPATPNETRPTRSATADPVNRATRSATADKNPLTRSATADPNLACSNLALNRTPEQPEERGGEERGSDQATDPRPEVPGASDPDPAATEAEADSNGTPRLRLRSPDAPSRLAQELSRAEQIRRLLAIQDNRHATPTPAAAGQEITTP